MKAKKVTLILMVALLLGAPGQGQKPSPSPGPQKLGPRVESDAMLLVRGRRVGIHRAAQEGTHSVEARLKYFQKPILAFRTAERPLSEDWPEPVYDVKRRGDQIYLILRLISATPRSLQQSREQVLQTPTEIAQLDEHPSLDPSRVEVDVWPTTRAYIAIEDRLKQGIPLAEGYAILGTSERWEFDIPIPVPSDQVEALKALLGSTDVRFKVSLEWEGLAQRSAIKEVVGEYEVKDVVEGVLGSSQIKPGGMIFRRDRDKITSKVSSQVSSAMSATDEEMVKMLANVELPSLFFEIERKDVGVLTQVEREALSKYLEPLVNEIKETEETTDKRTVTGEEALKVDFSLGLPNSGPVGLKLAPEHKRKLEHEFGVTLKKEEKSQMYVPHQVEVSRLREDWQQRTGKIVQRVAVATEARLATELEDYLTADFTQDVMKELLPVSESGDIYAEIPLGAMLCYFGAGEVPPPGFNWADGQGRWPLNAGWLRPGLRGAPLPDMRSRLVGGAADDQEVGLEWAKGVLEVPAPVKKETVPIAINANIGLIGTLPKAGGNPEVPVPDWQVPVVPHSRITNPDGKDRRVDIVAPLRVTTDRFSWPQEERTIPLNGPSANPPHVKCRWIIRTR